MLGVGLSACNDVESTLAPASAAPAPPSATASSQKRHVPAESFTTRADYQARFGAVALSAPSFNLAASGTGGTPAPLLPQWEPTLGASLDLDDDDCAAVPVGFSFTFYGRAYTTVYPSANGRVTLNYCSRSFAGAIPQDSAALVAPMAGDWLPTTGTADNVHYALVGTEPNRRLVITWNDMALYSSRTDARSSYQVQLLEGSNAVQVSYRAVGEVESSLTAGISSGRGPFVRTASGVDILRLQGQALCYVPNGADGYTTLRTACAAAVVNRTPAASVGGPYAGAEGSPVAFAGSATDADGDALRYSWNFGDGSPDAAGAAAAHTFADDGSYTVTLTVTDAKGAVDASSAVVQVGNVAPTAQFAAPGWANEGAPVALSLAGAADASGADRAAGFEYAFDCGAGYGAFGRSATASCVADDNGVREMRARVRDKDGGESEYAASVTVDNVAPRVASLEPVTVASGESYTLQSRFSDPGVRDMHWRYTADWGNGATTAGTTDDQDRPIVASRRYLEVGSYTAAVTVTDKDGGTARGTVRVTVVPQTVAIDVRDAGLRSADQPSGRLMVEVLSSAAIDASALAEGTVRLGRTGVLRRANGTFMTTQQDVNGDRRADLVLHFDRAELIRNGDLAPFTTELRLTGEMRDGRQVAGRDAVQMTPR